MRVMVIGAYGLIGGYVVARLLSDGHEVVGVGRDIASAQRRVPRVRWVQGDLTTMDTAGWSALLTGVDAVVNCAGALQDSPRDDVEAVHVAGMLTLARTCEASGVRRFVQISAAGVAAGVGAFGRTKLEGDTALSGLDLDWVILRPGLVLAPAAFGGSALLRGLAAFPAVIPANHADAVVQVISVDDLTEAVARCVRPEGPSKIICDLASAEPTPLGEVLVALRAWLGLRPAPVLGLPPATGRLAAQAADALAWLGWRSPMRTAAIKQLASGVRAQSNDGPRLLGVTPRSLAEILASWPSGVQERWFARLYFAKPLALVTLAAFWGFSGLIGLIQRDASAHILTQAGLHEALAFDLVMGGAFIDLALGALICARWTVRLALVGMIAVTAAYIVAASLWRPDLWGDPLGPLIKTAPAAVLALIVLALIDER